MLGLRWGDFDWKNHLLHVQRSVDFSMKKRGLPQPVSPLKTAAANRFVPIPASLEAILLPLRAGPEELVFSAEGAPLSGSVFRTRWNRLMASADFADASTHITPHHFRHHYITACVAAGLPPEVTMRIAGHSSYQTTIDIYTHLQAETLQKAAFNLDGVLRTTVSPKVAEATSPSDS